MAQARAWCLTLNNPPFPTDELPAHPRERYVCWQRERGANGTVHIQGYIELDRPCRLGAMRAWLPAAHFEPRNGTREQARAYCRKDDTRDEGDDAGPYERGDFSRGGSGARNDLADACATLRQHGLKRVAEDHPTAFVKFSRGLKELESALEEQPSDSDFVPRPWQARVLRELRKNPDDRTIFWVQDERGNRGKSRLVRHLVLEHNAIMLEGKIQDMAYMYNKEKIVCIDVTRAQAEMSRHLYTFAEKLKNGVLVSTKYESKSKIFKPPHVIFFSNSPPPDDVWTEDRLHLFNLGDPDMHSNVIQLQPAPSLDLD